MSAAILTARDLARYERMRAGMTPGMTAIAHSLMRAAFAGREPPLVFPAEPSPIYCAIAHSLVTDPLYMEQINMALGLDQMIAEVEATPDTKGN